MDYNKVLDLMDNGATRQQLEENGVENPDSLVKELSEQGHEILKSGEYYYLRERSDPVGSTGVNQVKKTRTDSKTKQSITRETKEFVKRLEDEIKEARNEYGPLEPSRGRPETDNGFDIVLHRTDDHFGDIVEREGEVIFSSDIAEERAIDCFDQAITMAENRTGNVDTFNLLLGGDMVTNETVYPSQTFEIDETIENQLERASRVYFSQIEKLSEEFPFVQVVCQHGNHADMGKGTSKHANVDDLFYNRLEMMCSTASLENVTFVKSDGENYTNFSMRGYRGHLRHGHNVNTHIGTSSPQSTWRGFLYNHDFDIAYRGHYHNHKIEHVSGKPVIMAPAFKPCNDFEEKQGIFGKPMSYVHGVDDSSPLAWTEYINYDN